VDFEKRIATIYQRCRKHEDIKVAFDQLQLELSLEINESMTQTRRKLLDNFDDEVREKLKVRADASVASLNRVERTLMRLTAHELKGYAEFVSEDSFRLKASPFPGAIPLGLYELPRRSGEAHLYRLHHPLAEAVIAQAKGRDLHVQDIRFDYGAHEGIISILEPLVGKFGWLTLSCFTIESLDQTEGHLIFGALTDDGNLLDVDCAARLFTLPGKVIGPCQNAAPAMAEVVIQQRQATIKRTISERNARFFEAEADKLDGWSDDLKLSLEREIKEMDRQIKEARRAATTALTLEDKLAGQKQIKALESHRNEKRRSLFDAQDKVDLQREALISNIEGKLTQKSELNQLFTVRWSLI
jgi:adenine-specific DNA-methyltransferase